ncbi:MAG: DUF1294 domain-containing protein [Eubacterium sp.]|nr:DUF1294 domain-containing protein [Eubacterium sp.]
MEVLNAVSILYVIVVNIVGFLMMGIDKLKARKHRRRISERTLFVISIIGGSVGSLAGMYLFRHKTRHTKFVVGIPVILAIQIIVGVLIASRIQDYFG